MQEEISSSIERYIEYFKNQISEINEISGESSKLYKKILYCSIIDALAKVVYPYSKNRDRFISFLRNFSKWKDLEKVTVPHLYHLLHKNPDPVFQELREYITSIYRSSPVHNASIVGIDQDPDTKDLIKFFPNRDVSKYIIANINLESLKHVSLFYAYRNSLIHEYRSPGMGPEMQDAKSPFYIMRSEIDFNRSEVIPVNIELVYPVAFFSQMCSDCLIKLGEYLHKNLIDPYQFYKFGSYWYPELNQ